MGDSEAAGLKVLQVLEELRRRLSTAQETEHSTGDCTQHRGLSTAQETEHSTVD